MARPAWLVLAISHVSNSAPARLWIAVRRESARRPARGLRPAARGKLSWTAGPLVCGRRGHPVSYNRFLASGRPGEPDRLPDPRRIKTGGRRRTHRLVGAGGPAGVQPFVRRECRPTPAEAGTTERPFGCRTGGGADWPTLAPDQADPECRSNFRHSRSVTKQLVSWQLFLPRTARPLHDRCA